ncbi:hypothetical protein M405DRAFT_465855 [Rhizopogon salebrosus TDB-379]|nr:hypothetical protein M405DRAFT_465855 [Rhizopogon salebrosus TDB-379]
MSTPSHYFQLSRGLAHCPALLFLTRRVESRIVMHYLSISRLGIFRPRQPGHHTIQVDGISLFAGYDFSDATRPVPNVSNSPAVFKYGVLTRLRGGPRLVPIFYPHANLDQLSGDACTVPRLYPPIIRSVASAIAEASD